MAKITDAVEADNPLRVTESELGKYLAKRKFDPSDPVFRQPTIHKLRQKPCAIEDLAEFLGVTERNVRLMIASLRSAGYMVYEADGRFQIGRLRADTEIKIKRTRITSMIAE